MLFRFLSAFLVLLSTASFAHPVIFEGGTVISSSNMGDFSDNQVLYSFNPKWATGLNHWAFRKENQNTEFVFARLNHLLKRFNGPDSQANIYLLSGVGIVDSEFERRDTRDAYMGGVEMDWETRTLFAAIKHYQFSSPGLIDLGMTQARIGFSPVERGFEELQSWFMVQAMYTPELNRTITITPLLRFFYHNILWEMGSSTRGEWLLNIMVHM